MKKLNYYDYEEGIFEFASNEDKEAYFECWDNDIILYYDEFGRVFTEVNKYIADIIY